MTVQLFVVYPAGEGKRFDRDYYVATHLPLVESGFGPHGLTSAQGFFPREGGPHVAVAVLSFADEAAVGAALGSDAAPGVMGDVPNFTDIEPVILRGAAL